MTQYKLKKGIENFDVVDGAFAGRKFVRGKVYGEVPPDESKKFDEIKPIEVRDQKSEVKDRKSEIGDQKSEIKDRKSEIGGQKPKSRNR